MNYFQSEKQEDTESKRSKMKHSDNIQCELTYLVDDIIHIQFFKSKKFLSYFINYIKKETFPIDIQITPIDSKEDKLFGNYIIKLTGKKTENRVVRRFIKILFESIKLKTYHQNKVRKWLFNSILINLIQNIFDNENQLFTVCQLNTSNKYILEIYYFNDDKFNSFDILTEIDHVIQNKILQEDILISSNEYPNTIEFVDINSRKILLKYHITPTKQYEKELNENIKSYEQNSTLISVTQYSYPINKQKPKDIIRIIGYRKCVEEVFQKFKDLFDKHRLRKLKLSQISLNQVCSYCLFNLINITYRLLTLKNRMIPI